MCEREEHDEHGRRSPRKGATGSTANRNSRWRTGKAATIDICIADRHRTLSQTDQPRLISDACP